MGYNNHFINSVLMGTIIILFTGGSSFCFAQNSGSGIRNSNQFRLGSRIIRVAEPGQLADSVNVWGDINSPGRYLIPVNTTLPELISYAFGPQTRSTSSTQLNWSKRHIEVSVSQYNPAKGKEMITHFKFRLNEPLPEGMRKFDLENNQVVSIRVRRQPTIGDYLGVIAPVFSAVGVIVLLVLRLTRF